jgi:hypothetical protein
MIHGVGLSLSHAVCSGGFAACITLLLICKGAWSIVLRMPIEYYLKNMTNYGLVEIAYGIWPNGGGRRSSNIYKLGLVPLAILVGILAIGLYGG